MESTYEFYRWSRLRLAVAGFWMCKFITNSAQLHARIQENKLHTAGRRVETSAVVSASDVEKKVGGGGEEKEQTHVEETG